MKRGVMKTIYSSSEKSMNYYLEPWETPLCIIEFDDFMLMMITTYDHA